MPDLLAPAREPFLRRVSAPPWVAIVAARWPRFALAAALAAAPPLLAFVAIALGPDGLRAAATDPQNVRDTFARFITAVVTASSIAVSVAALALRQELKGLREAQRSQETNAEFRDQLREALGEDATPLALGELAADALEGVARQAEKTRHHAREHAGRTTMGVTLGDYLDTVAARARGVARAMRDVGARPDRLHLAFLDMEHDVVAALARRFGRDEGLPSGLRDALDELHHLLTRTEALQRYMKTLDTQWGLSRMSHAILLTTIPSLATAAGMTLLYGEGLRDAWGAQAAAAVVCLALAIALFPIAAFVSYLVRFVFLNQHTLPSHGFLLGPEEPAAVGPSPASDRVVGRHPNIRPDRR